MVAIIVKNLLFDYLPVASKCRVYEAPGGQIVAHLELCYNLPAQSSRSVSGQQVRALRDDTCAGEAQTLLQAQVLVLSACCSQRRSGPVLRDNIAM